MTYPVGTQVRISPDSSHYGTDDSNPADEVGVITDNDRFSMNGYVYMVKWKSYVSNCYRHSDLVPICKELNIELL